PSVQLPTVAIPLAFVVWLAPVIVPPPRSEERRAATFGTGLLNSSRTSTAGGVATAVPTGALWLFPAAITRELASPSAPVAVKVSGLSPLEVAVSVFVPAVVPSVQLPTVAIPLAFVVWLAPVIVPPP